MKNTCLKRAATVILSAIITLALTSCGSSVKTEALYDNGMVTQDSVATYSGGFNYFSATGTDSSAKYKAEAPRENYVEKEAEDIKAVTDTDGVYTERKIIYTSSYDLQTKDFDASVAALDALMEKYGAYFESSNTYGTAESANRRSHFTIRVPKENYDAFTESTGTLGVVISSSQNNKDVTESYYDTEARLESAKIREERVLEILKNASKLDDVLALERELADIRYEIESFTGTLRKYDSLVNYSTVTLSITEVTDVVVPKTAPLTFSERMNKGFKSGIADFIDGAENFAVFLSYNLIGIVIWLAIIGLAVGLIAGNAKKRKRKKAEEKRMAEEAARRNAE